MLVELEPVQFLTGLRADTILLIDEFWVIIKTPGGVREEPQGDRDPEPAGHVNGSHYTGIPGPGTARSAFDNRPPMCRP